MSLLSSNLMDMLGDELTMEGRQFLGAQKSSDYALYVLVTDTNTAFSKVSKFVTQQPYNHVSLMFDDSFDEIFTYSLMNPDNGFKGGFKIETRKDLKGARFSLYRVGVSEDAWFKIRRTIDDLVENRRKTSYNIQALVNFVFDKNIFESADETRMICSEFVVFALNEAGIQLKKTSKHGLLSPYEIVRDKALQHVRRGKIR